MDHIELSAMIARIHRRYIRGAYYGSGSPEKRQLLNLLAMPQLAP